MIRLGVFGDDDRRCDITASGYVNTHGRRCLRFRVDALVADAVKPLCTCGLKGFLPENCDGRMLGGTTSVEGRNRHGRDARVQICVFEP